MATTNFLLWNPSKNNQLTDSGYENNIMRSEGAPVGQILPSELANKLFYPKKKTQHKSVCLTRKIYLFVRVILKP